MAASWTRRSGAAKCKLTLAQVAELEAVLDAGPAACGYEDQRWTLARVADQGWQRFGRSFQNVLSCYTGGHLLL